MNSFRHLHQPTNRTIHLENKNFLFFGGTAYLGLLVNPQYQSLVKEGINIYGLNNGTSRSNNVQLGIYDEAEQVLASRFGYADAALFSSGYLAAQTAVKTLSKNRKVHYAPNCHQSLWLDEKPEVAYEDFNEWLVNVVEVINQSSEVDHLIIANAIDNLTPQLYDFSSLGNIDKNKHVYVLLDDSHGLAVVHKNDVSANVSALASCLHIELVIVASLAKGLGTDAGVVLGGKEVITQVKKSPIFMGASPSSPGFIYALVKGEGVQNEAFDTLQQNIASFKAMLNQQSKFKYVDRFPVFTSIDSNLYRYLCTNDIVISSFPYPLPSSPLLNRVVISALHTQKDLQKLTDVLQRYV